MDKPPFESYRANEFTLEIDGLLSPSVSKVSGLSEGEIETVEQPDGGTNHVYKLAGNKVKFEPLMIERYVDGSPDDAALKDWFSETFVRIGAGAGSSARRSEMVHKYHNGDAGWPSPGIPGCQARARMQPRLAVRVGPAPKGRPAPV